MLAIAAAVAALASTVAVLVHTGRDASTSVAVRQPTAVADVKPTQVAVAAAVEEPVEFSIVPSYQSFAFSVPTSIAPTGVDEYDRQARATSTTTDPKATADDASPTVQ